MQLCLDFQGRRKQELFSYTFNNAYVPKLTLWCLFTQVSVYELSHFCCKLWGYDWGLWEGFCYGLHSIEFQSELPTWHLSHSREPFSLLYLLCLLYLSAVWLSATLHLRPDRTVLQGLPDRSPKREDGALERARVGVPCDMDDDLQNRIASLFWPQFYYRAGIEKGQVQLPSLEWNRRR